MTRQSKDKLRTVLVRKPEQQETRLFSGVKHIKKRKFLTAFSQCGGIRRAAALAGVDAKMHYVWLENDPGYAELFERAKSIAADNAEDAVYERAFLGTDHELSYKGLKTGHTTKETSDLLSMFWLKAHRPEYKDGLTYGFGPAQINLQVNVGPTQTAAFEANSRPALPATVEANKGMDDDGDLPPANVQPSDT